MATRITIKNPQDIFTCINCNVRFQTAEMQRDHYKSDWHRYNLKRRVNELTILTAEEFQLQVEKQRMADRNATLPNENIVCEPCQKVFTTKQSLDNHLNSRKHKDGVKQFEMKNKRLSKIDSNSSVVAVKVPDDYVNVNGNLIKKDIDQTCTTIEERRSVDVINDESDEDDDFEIIDSDAWNEDEENVIEVNDCLFCKEKSLNMIANLKHMSVAHSFFVPDIEYTCDLAALLEYLAIKITQDFICLWCNDSGKTFYSLDAVQKHMIDKGHCKMLHEGSALAEYTDFYDYSSTYPDNGDDMDIDEEITPEILDGEEYQLVLPSGAVIGHRSLLRYYKQRLNPERRLIPSKSNRKLHKVLAEYRSLGWTSTQLQAAAKKASDIHHMKRQYQKLSMRLGVKANKLQRHFRQQVDF